MELFAYGTLMYPEVLVALLGRAPVSRPAVAPGWRVAALPGRVYPGLVADPARRAAGVLLAGLTAAEVRLLDAYEDTDYELTDVALDGGARCRAYVWRTEVLAEDWDPRAFATVHLATYVTHCARWRAGYPPR